MYVIIPPWLQNNKNISDKKKTCNENKRNEEQVWYKHFFNFKMVRHNGC